ncbi:MAG TPA: hypothetical protein VFC24_02920 [Casimicrobiaceae bacterium]|nr:hypothetical protein [Casimicrobiaceae bacterium]
MDFDLGKRVMNVATLATLVWRLFAPSHEHGSGFDDALLQLSGGGTLSRAHHTGVAVGYEPYLACATAPDATAMQLHCDSIIDRS